jgi:uncharacterized protein (TIGR03067 family)
MSLAFSVQEVDVLKCITMLMSVAYAGIAANAEEAASDERAIQGRWEYVLVKRGDALVPPSPEEAEAKVTIDVDAIRRTVVGIPTSMRYSLDAKARSNQITITATDDGKTIVLKGVYLLRSNVLVVKLNEPGEAAPNSIDFRPDENGDFFVLGRVAAPAE